MNSFFGRININKNLFEDAIVKISAKNLADVESCIKDNVGFAQTRFNPHKQTCIEKGSFIICSDCRIDNKEELKKSLSINNLNPNDDELILSAYKTWGDKCTEFLLGDFAFTIWDKKNKKLFCGRDHFGLKPFFFYHKDDTFIVSSEISAILSQTDLKFTIDKQYIANTISIVKSEKDRTQFNEIKKIPPAHILTFQNHTIKIEEYWKLEPQELLNLPNDEIIKRFKDLIIESIRFRIQEGDVVGSELSGGLDSSTISAFANQMNPLIAFSHVLPKDKVGKIHPLKDEKEQIGLVRQFCKIKKSFEIKSDETGVLSAIKNNLEGTGYISQQNFSVFSDELYKKAAKEGVSVLLSGFGGDEGITSKSGFYLEELAINSNWKELFLDLKEQKLGWYKTHKRFIKYFIKTKIPFLHKLISSINKQKPWWYEKYNQLAIAKDFEEKLNVKSNYFSNFESNSALSTQEINIERLTHPHVSQRLEYCSLAARKYGIEYRYPFFDKRLIEFYLSMPAKLKARNGIQRYAIRKATEGILPKEIQWRNDKSGATIPTVFMRTLMDKDEILEIIHRSKSNKNITKYINLDKYENWFHKLLDRSIDKNEVVNPGAFYNYLKLILYIEKYPELFND
jgi:asparagine synthase (glutamine-hydrolysing)